MAVRYESGCDGINENLLNSCDPTTGGLIGSLYLVSYRQIASITSSTSDNVYDSIIMKTDPSTPDPFFWLEVEFKENTTGITTNAVFGNNNYFSQEVTFTVNGQSPELVRAMNKMLTGKMVAIGVDQKGQAYLIGAISGAKATAIASGTGATLDDINGVSVYTRYSRYHII